MNYLSLFTGIGGFELGIKQAYENNRPNIRNRSSDILEGLSDTSEEQDRVTCIGYSEIDKYAIQIFEKHFKGVKNYGDITKIKAEELPDFDLLVGGFPCQAFSIAGKRGGFSDTRGTLFFDIARIIKQKQPRLLLLENVKGLLSHDKGNTFYTIISTLDELGYDCQWQVLNSKNFGVPQNRERVFIVGHLRGTSRPKVFPIGGTDKEDTKIQYVNKSDKKDFRTFGEEGIAPALQARGDTHKLHQLNQPKHSNDRVYGTDGVSPTLNTAQGGNRQPFIAPVLTPDRLTKRQNGRRIKDNGEPSFTLTGQDKHGVQINSKIRRLTPVECERLQGFPDVEKSCIIEVCLDQRNNLASAESQNLKLQKLVGNAVKKDLKENVKFVSQNLNTKDQPISKLAQPDVLIDCVENGVEINSQGKLLLNAVNAGKKNWSHQLIKIDDFVQLLVGLNTTLEKEIASGKEGLQKRGQCLIAQENGKKLVKLFGKEIMLPVGDVETDLIILRKLLKFTTLDHLGTENSEPKSIILSSFVTRAIIGYIPKEILNQNTFTIEVKTKVGWTEGLSDTQRYKTLGNAVTTNVVQAIMERLL